jgi:NADPH-dependent 2,4-dienoyl-CoA reductase/sulfur reductase-like enzyme
VADPFFPKKAEEGRSEDIAPCIRCNVGCLERPEGSLTCTVNIAVGREDEFKITREVKRKKVAIIGGGPGGMEAARVAAMMGHEVILFEKRRMGGMLIEASVPKFKSDLQFLIDYLSTQIKKLKVEVITEEANVETIKNRGVEVVIISAGATQIVPDVPGVEKSIAICALDVLNGADVGKEVLVVGGGLVGSEIALFLAEKNKNVTIVEMLDQILPGAHVATSRQAFFERLKKHRVRIVTNTKLDEITGDGIITKNQDGTKTKLLGDTVVLALGLKADSKLYDELSSLTDIDVYTVGDYAEPRKIYHAIHEGHLAARNL